MGRLVHLEGERVTNRSDLQESLFNFGGLGPTTYSTYWHTPCPPVRHLLEFIEFRISYYYIIMVVDYNRKVS